MDLKMGFQAAIFDLDGTLADSLDVWSRIDIEFFAKRGMQKPDGYQEAVKCMGFPQAAAYTKKRFSFKSSESEIIAEWSAMARHEYAEKIPLKAGARDYIAALHAAGVKVGLATASGRELFEPLLRRCGVFSFFDAFVTTSQTGKDKNSPDVYLACAENLGCDRQKCMVYEDLLSALLVAKSAGMKTTGVFDRHWAAEQEKLKVAADCYITSFEDALRGL